MSDLPTTTRVRKNLLIGGKRVTFSLEAIVWDTLTEICRRESLCLDELCDMAVAKSGDISMASALRIVTLRYFRALADAETAGGKFVNPLSRWMTEGTRAAA